MTKLSKSRIANTLNIKVYRCEILFIREEILSVGLPPVRFFDVRKRRFGSRFLRFALFLPFFSFIPEIFYTFAAGCGMQYFSLLFKRESGWNPEQCPLL